MTLTVRFAMDNEAFQDDWGREAGCILVRLGKRLEAEQGEPLLPIILVDVQGNVVGQCDVEGR